MRLSRWVLLVTLGEAVAVRRRWVVATSIAAAVAWSLGILPSILNMNWTAGTVVAAAIGVLILLSSLPLGRYVVLRDHVRPSARWIPISMAAWLAGIVWTRLPSRGLISQVGALIFIYGIAGLCMAATVAMITGLGMIRLLRPFDAARSASLACSEHAEGAYSTGLHSAGSK